MKTATTRDGNKDTYGLGWMRHVVALDAFLEKPTIFHESDLP